MKDSAWQPWYCCVEVNVSRSQILWLIVRRRVQFNDAAPRVVGQTICDIENMSEITPTLYVYHDPDFAMHY